LNVNKTNHVANDRGVIIIVIMMTVILDTFRIKKIMKNNEIIGVITDVVVAEAFLSFALIKQIDI
jgi:hypothetical protein